VRLYEKVHLVGQIG